MKTLLSVALFGFASVLVLHAQAQTSKQPMKLQPKLEPIAETKLLMEGLAHSNFRGLERILSQKEIEPQSWTFARGQAILIAESANLLMLRPPRSQGQPVWFERAIDMRNEAIRLAQTVSKKDVETARSGLVHLADSCNKCHQTFRIAVQIEPFAEKNPQTRLGVE